MRVTLPASAIVLTCLVTLAVADGPKDNIPDQVRPIPPRGIDVSEDDTRELLAGLQQLVPKIEALRGGDAFQQRYLPDVEIFLRAVHDAVEHGEFFAPREVESAKQLIKHGLERADSLAAGKAPWTRQKGLVVRGFVSKLDHTVQPYGLVIPESYTFEGQDRYRLDLWFHGRGERLSENNFVTQRMKQTGRIAPTDTIVLHPYGRYSNAFKFAGEVDVLEALEHASRNYRIDADRVAVRGFSMGGAGCWQMAVHYPGRFFAANPGAGFSETPEFLKFFQKETLTPTWYEEKLWRWYDCPGYVVNLFNLPTVAYSGELDIQKQAADIMADAYERERMRLTHVIGPETKHTIHADSAKIIEAKLANLAERGRDALPKRVRFATYTLKYNRSHWVEVTGLDEHWEQARVEASLVEPNHVSVATKNVRGLSLSIPAGRSPFEPTQPVIVEVNAKRYEVASSASDRSWEFHLWDGKQQDVAGPPDDGLRKRANLQGPIDDAFMDSFLVVRPTGTAAHDAVEKWTQSELAHFVQHWRQQFRGYARVKPDKEITDDDIASSNLILFGDPASNSVLKRIAPELPIQWTSESVIVGDRKFAADQHAPVLIYPNPLNPNRYVVLNSGFTYREYDYLNNARQVPKLPDWAVIDLRTPPDNRYPGKVVDAEFFDEQWRLKPAR